MSIELVELKELLFAMETRLQKNIKDDIINELNPRFDAIDKRFEEVDKRFEQVDQRFDDLEQSLLGKMDVIAKQTQQNSFDIQHLSIMMTSTERQLKIHSVQLMKLTAYVEKRQKQAGKTKNSRRKTHPFQVIHLPHLTPRKED